jgi:hypothetical protein
MQSTHSGAGPTARGRGELLCQPVSFPPVPNPRTPGAKINSWDLRRVYFALHGLSSRGPTGREHSMTCEVYPAQVPRVDLGPGSPWIWNRRKGHWLREEKFPSSGSGDRPGVRTVALGEISPFSSLSYPLQPQARLPRMAHPDFEAYPIEV